MLKVLENIHDEKLLRYFVNLYLGRTSLGLVRSDLMVKLMEELGYHGDFCCGGFHCRTFDDYDVWFHKWSLDYLNLFKDYLDSCHFLVEP